MTTPHEAFLATFHDDRKPLLEAMLHAITEACPNLSETIKWNAPTLCDESQDRLTFMLHKKDQVMLILHTGAKAKEDKKAPRLYQDDTGLLEWISNIRAMIVFRDLADFASKSNLLQEAVRRWVNETKNLGTKI